MQKKKKQNITIALMTVIAALLAVILAVLPGGGEDDTASEAEDYTEAVGAPEEHEPVAIEDTAKPAEPEHPEQPSDDSSVKPEPKKNVFIIIDDVGNNLSQLDQFLELPIPVTFAIMPGRTYSEESARRIEKAGFDMILHQPMEPVGSQDPGKGAITTEMEKAEIREILDENLSGLPVMTAVNNHMGSKATTDERVMGIVLSYLEEHDMFFIDSYTTNKSAVRDAAVKLGLPYVRRTGIFLDNEGEPEKIEKALLAGIDAAEKSGTAILIGHLRSEALPKIIEKLYPEIEARGYAFRGVDALDL